SQLHYKVKREIYSSLKNHPNCTKCELERRLDGVYPDISLYINGTPVVIEVQKSVINIDLIMKRTLRYSKLGCYVLWVLPNGQPKQFQHLIRKKNEDGSLVEKEMIVSRPKQWEKYLHTLYFGRLYYWQNGAVVAPYHFEKVEQYVQESGCEWYNEYGEEQSEYWGGHPKTLKAIKYFTRCEDIDIMTEFTKSQRNKWNTDNMSIPSCKLWIDNKKKWW
ncbi:MAG: competence protein CoiA family protein, partial [Candidatus Delongbacteria bacterium]